MKKLFVVVTLLVLASILVAAVPLGKGQGICYDPLKHQWVPCNGHWKYKYPGQGEPRMEKITYFNYVQLGKETSYCETGGSWNAGCYNWYYCVKTYKLPMGCNFRYQY